MYSQKKVYAGKLAIGGDAPISVQSMTNTDSRDADKTLAQIKELALAGCELVRVSVFDRISAENVRFFVDHSPVPLCADIHFDVQLAIKSMENGIQKLRINPGNIGGAANVRKVADCARMHRVPIRIGVNAGSLEERLLGTADSLPDAMVQSALEHIRLLEEQRYTDLVLSLKASDVRTTVEAYRKIRQHIDYPLHIGITEAGLKEESLIASSIGIGTLLLEGIGDTLRVSMTGDPLHEVEAGIKILHFLGLRNGLKVIACPTCGRTRIDVESTAREIREKLKKYNASNLVVAVMGCVVNGPGEAREADVALCGGDGSAALYVKGQFVKKIECNYSDEIIMAVESYLHDNA